MRNPFARLLNVVRSVFVPKAPAPIHVSKPIERPSVTLSALPVMDVYTATQSHRTARRRERKAIRAFVRALNQSSSH